MVTDGAELVRDWRDWRDCGQTATGGVADMTPSLQTQTSSRSISPAYRVVVGWKTLSGSPALTSCDSRVRCNLIRHTSWLCPVPARAVLPFGLPCLLCPAPVMPAPVSASASRASGSGCRRSVPGHRLPLRALPAPPRRRHHHRHYHLGLLFLLEFLMQLSQRRGPMMMMRITSAARRQDRTLSYAQPVAWSSTSPSPSRGSNGIAGGRVGQGRSVGVGRESGWQVGSVGHHAGGPGIRSETG